MRHFLIMCRKTLVGVPKKESLTHMQNYGAILLQLSTSPSYQLKRTIIYSEKSKAKLVAADGLDIWRGFYQSLRSTQMGTTTIVDVSSAPFLRPLPVLDFISKFLKINTSHKLNDQQRKKITDAFNKVKVEITHRKGVRLIY